MTFTLTILFDFQLWTSTLTYLTIKLKYNIRECKWRLLYIYLFHSFSCTATGPFGVLGEVIGGDTITSYILILILILYTDDIGTLSRALVVLWYVFSDFSGGGAGNSAKKVVCAFIGSPLWCLVSGHVVTTHDLQFYTPKVADSRIFVHEGSFFARQKMAILSWRGKLIQ